jgi:coproporphyrinogen III oxidase
MKTKDIYKSFSKVQEIIISEIQQLDSSSKKNITKWKHGQGGGGLSCEISGNKNIEKAAVNFSSIIGEKLPSSALEKTGMKGLKKFNATGVSVIVHPWNPKAPCAHLNIRFFEAVVGKKTIWWFGGGFDLTPYFISKSDILFWKNSAETLCNKYNKGFYKKYNVNCNKYFFLPHRNEPRGIGGIFFDQLNNLDYDVCKSFALDCAATFIQSYSKLFNKKKNLKYTKKEKAFQLYRRGRYVEFNLLYDRGTLFGLQSGGRSESILMSMPPKVSWSKDYNFEVYEQKLLKMFALARQ